MRIRHMNLEQPSPAINEYLEATKLYDIAHIKPFHINSYLASALLEQWRPKYHTFHFLCRECTMTLKDVTLHFRLPINGNVVTRGTNFNVPVL